MNCRDFEQVWNRLLDDEPRSRRLDVDGDPAARESLEGRLREHAQACEACRARQLQFEALREALRAWSDRLPVSSAPPLRLADRALEIAARPGPTRRGRAWVAAAASMMAAAVVAAVAILPPSSLVESIAEAPAAPTAQRDLLGEAVDDAAAASWHLARLAAEPAAWLGREIIDASFTSTEIEPRPLEIALLDSAAGSELGSDAPAPGLFRGMGRYLSAGVEPVSTSAREAFGFLRPPTPQ